MRKDQVAVDDYLFCFDEIRNIALIIEPSAQVPRPRLPMSPSRYENHFKLFTIECTYLMFKIPLNDRYYPFGVNLVIKNVLAYIIVPEISFVAGFPHALMPS